MNTKLKYLTLSILGLLLYILFSIVSLNLFGNYSIPLIYSIPIALIIIIKYEVRKLFYLFIIFLPILQHYNFIAIEIGDFIITPSSIYLIILFMLAFYDNTEEKISLSYKSIPNNSKILLIIVVVSSIISQLINYNNMHNNAKQLLLFYTGIIESLFFIFIINKYYMKYLNDIILCIVLSVLSSVIVAFIEIQSIGFSIVNIYMNRVAIGFGYHNTNLFGIVSALLIPVTIYYYRFGHKINYTYSVVITICLFSLFCLSLLTLNRGTILVLFFQIVMMGVPKQLRKTMSVVIIAICLVGLYNYDLILIYSDRFSGVEVGEKITDPSALYRLEAWKVGFESIISNPFGLGAGGFQQYWENHGIDPTFFLGTPHQLFLSIAVDYGFLSAISFLLLLVIMIWKGFIQFIRKNNVLLYTTSISFLSYLIYGMITDGELSHLSGSVYPNNAFTFFLILIIFIHYGSEKFENENS
ncbi:MAG: O-antigen ligase family protein [Bacteroidetes bacterium]|nr:O-antigen ligase family protein [Bacteroidota bacterium]